MKDPLKPRDKVTQKMSRDGLIEVNETKESIKRIRTTQSSRNSRRI